MSTGVNGTTQGKALTLREALLATRGSRPRVLVAEDDAEVRALMEEELRKNGFEVVSVRDGLAALDFLHHAATGHTPPFDVVVSDVRMPRLSGLELLEHVGHDNLEPHCILVTAFGSPETHREALRLGAWAVLDKPFELDELAAAVRNAT